MREVKGFAGGDKGRDGRPRLRLRGVREKVHDDGSTVDGLLNREERLAGHLHPRMSFCMIGR